MTRKNDAERQEAITDLRKMLKPGDTVYTLLKHVSRSGMSRNIDVYIIKNNQPLWIAGYVGKAIGSPQSRKNWERSQGLTVGGCGMDMGFHLVYSLGRALWPEGFPCAGDGCPSNDHFNRENRNLHTDGGYALRQRWM